MKEFKGTKQEWVRDGRMVYALEDGENRFYAGFAPGRNCLKGEAEANAQLAMTAPDLLEALQDMLSGWKYIREQHGDLYGVGWDRAQDKAQEAISKALG